MAWSALSGCLVAWCAWCCVWGCGTRSKTMRTVEAATVGHTESSKCDGELSIKIERDLQTMVTLLDPMLRENSEERNNIAGAVRDRREVFSDSLSDEQVGEMLMIDISAPLVGEYILRMTTPESTLVTVDALMYMESTVFGDEPSHRVVALAPGDNDLRLAIECQGESAVVRFWGER